MGTHLEDFPFRTVCHRTLPANVLICDMEINHNSHLLGQGRGLHKLYKKAVRNMPNKSKSTMDIGCTLILTLIITFETQHCFENDPTCDIMLMRQWQGPGQVEAGSRDCSDSRPPAIAAYSLPGGTQIINEI